MNNDVDGISFLLRYLAQGSVRAVCFLLTVCSHGANKNQTADDGLLAIDYARSCNALNAVERLS
jgi:hypothetical protein